MEDPPVRSRSFDLLSITKRPPPHCEIPSHSQGTKRIADPKLSVSSVISRLFFLPRSQGRSVSTSESTCRVSKTIAEPQSLNTDRKGIRSTEGRMSEQSASLTTTTCSRYEELQNQRIIDIERRIPSSERAGQASGSGGSSFGVNYALTVCAWKIAVAFFSSRTKIPSFHARRSWPLPHP